MSTAYKILVVDDEPDVELLIRQRFRQQIRDRGFNFEFALNGEEALTRLREDSNIDIVMSDINMPVMDGLTLLSRIHAMDRLLRTVIVSAYGDMQNIRIAMNRGAYDFLTKPIDFEDFEITLQKTMQEIEALRAGHRARKQLDSLESELSVASRIQQSMLPRRFPPFPERNDLEVYAEMEPARLIGGDFYDYFLIDPDRFAFVIGDVSGKGVPAALFMASTRTLLRATALQGASAAACVGQVNNVLARQSDGMFVTLFYGILDTRTGLLDYCSAGHHHPYVFSGAGGARVATQGGGMVAGLFEDSKYEECAKLQLRPGDGLLLYTDGVTEAEALDGEGGMFENVRLEQAIEEAATAPASEIVKSVLARVRAFEGSAPRTDDVTVLVVRYLG
jgi:sigma-B regulation protein RsbU (phosphoserine phosphatase)